MAAEGVLIMGNAFLDKIAAERADAMQSAERLTRQLMLDSLQITLHEEFGFGYDRIKRLTDALAATYNRFHDALTGGVEADVWQERLDASIADILKDKQEIVPFHERYPEIKRTRYDKPMRRGKHGV